MHKYSRMWPTKVDKRMALFEYRGEILFLVISNMKFFIYKILVCVSKKKKKRWNSKQTCG